MGLHDDRRWTPNWVISWIDLKPVVLELFDEYSSANPEHGRKKVIYAFQRIFTGCWEWSKDQTGWMSISLRQAHFSSEYPQHSRDVISSLIKFLTLKNVIEVQPGRPGRCTGYRPKNLELVNKLNGKRLEAQNTCHAIIRNADRSVSRNVGKGQGEKRVLKRRKAIVKTNEKLNSQGWYLPDWAIERWRKFEGRYIEMLHKIGTNIEEKELRVAVVHALRDRPVIDGLVDVSFLAPQKTVFSEHTSRGGRITSAFLGLPKELRRCLVVDGEPCIELDFAAFNPNLIYFLSGSLPPSDPYYIEVGGNQIPRGLAKVGVNIMITCGQKKTRRGVACSSLRQNCSLPCPPSAFLDVVEKKYEGVANMFYRGLWWLTQAVESEVVKYVVGRLNKKKIKCVSVHDGFVVAHQHGPLLRKLMVDGLVHALAVHLEAQRYLLNRIPISPTIYGKSFTPIRGESETQRVFEERIRCATSQAIKISEKPHYADGVGLGVALKKRFVPRLKQERARVQAKRDPGERYCDRRQLESRGWSGNDIKKRLGAPHATEEFKLTRDDGTVVICKRGFWIADWADLEEAKLPRQRRDQNKKKWEKREEVRVAKREKLRRENQESIRDLREVEKVGAYFVDYSGRSGDVSGSCP
jgi:hypothetical protein